MHLENGPSWALPTKTGRKRSEAQQLKANHTAHSVHDSGVTEKPDKVKGNRLVKLQLARSRRNRPQGAKWHTRGDNAHEVRSGTLEAVTPTRCEGWSPVAGARAHTSQNGYHHGALGVSCYTTSHGSGLQNHVTHPKGSALPLSCS